MNYDELNLKPPTLVDQSKLPTYGPTTSSYSTQNPNDETCASNVCGDNTYYDSTKRKCLLSSK